LGEPAEAAPMRDPLFDDGAERRLIRAWAELAPPGQDRTERQQELAAIARTILQRRGLTSVLSAWEVVRYHLDEDEWRAQMVAVAKHNRALAAEVPQLARRVKRDLRALARLHQDA